MTIQFKGKVSDDMSGFYQSRYSEAGQPQMLAVTDFEPSNARKAFPCFDEPGIPLIFVNAFNSILIFSQK